MMTEEPVEELKTDPEIGGPVIQNRSGRSKQWAFGVAIGSMVFLVGAFFIANAVFKNSASVRNEVSGPKTAIIPTGTSPVPTREKPAKMWLLKHKTATGSAELLTLCEDCRGNYLSHIALWRNRLIYSGFGNGDIYVKSFDLRTNTEQVIFTPEFDVYVKNKLNADEISNFQIIDDTLYVSLGGYLRTGGILWENLPPKGDPRLLTKSRNAGLVKWKDRQWLIGGEGDACWGITNFSLVDLAAKKVTEIATSTSGCYDGEEFVDVDKRNRMILAFHTSGNGESSEGNNGIYQYVIAIPLDNPTIKEGVIAKQEMPADITEVKYDPVTDSLYLYGKKNYQYSFGNKLITEADKLPEVPAVRIPRSSSKDINDQIKDLTLPAGYEFVADEF